MGRRRAGNLVLDIDGTLIDSIHANQRLSSMRSPDFVSEWGDYIYFRPGLEQFLLYCFTCFENVAIWTAASPEWAETILFALQPMLGRVRDQIRRQRAASMPPMTSSQRNLEELDETAATEGLEPKPRSSDLMVDSDCLDDMFSFVFTKNRCSTKLIKDERSSLMYEYHTKPLRKVWRSSSWRSRGWTPANTLILEDTPENCVSNYGNALYITTFKIMQESRGRVDNALQVLTVFLDRLRNVDDVRSLEKRDWERLCASCLPQAQTTKPAPLKKQARSAPALFEEVEEKDDEKTIASSSICDVLITPRAHYSIFGSYSNQSSQSHEQSDDEEDSDSDESDSEATDASDPGDVDSDSDIESDSSDEGFDISNPRSSSLPISPFLHRMLVKREKLASKGGAATQPISLVGKEALPEGL